MNTKSRCLNIKKIFEILPHRYPFLLIDRVLDFEISKYLIALKNCTINEHFFQGHFFKNPVFPGVLVIESMVQAAGILIYQSVGFLNINQLYYFIGIEQAQFKKNIIPGDQVIIKVFFLESRKNLIKFKVFAVVNKKNVCNAIIVFLKKI